jgi:hypothetical protein
MREAKRKRLREAWSGNLTAAQISRANAISESTLRRFWDEERAAGRLPAADVPRPHFAQHAKRTPAIDALALVADNDDGSPIADPNPSFQAPCDALLTVLAAHHPELDHPGVQDVPADLLRFDRRGMPAPSHGMLMALCRAADFGARVRAVAERAPA